MAISFRKPGIVPSSNVYPRDIPPLVENLRRFIGADELNRRMQEYRKRQAVSDGIGVVRLRERQAVLDGFKDYRKQTLGGNRPLRSVTREVALLTSVAGLCQTIAPTLRGGIERHHRDRLVNLDGQLPPLLLEWAMASFYVRKYGAELAWFEASETGPELVAHADGLEWELECKRLTPMITELLGDAEADKLASSVMRVIKSAGHHGEFALAFPPSREPLTAGDLDLIETEVRANISHGDVDLVLLGDIAFTGVSSVTDGKPMEADAWRAQLELSKQPDARLYAVAGASSGRAVNPITLQLSASRRSPPDLLHYLWERKFRTAASQCTSRRGAVLAFEWSGIDDPSVFADSEGMQDLMKRTFAEFRHVAVIVMRCGTALVHEVSGFKMDTNAYVARSEVSDFPQIAALKHLDDSQ